MIPKELDSGVWTGCLAHLTSFTLEARGDCLKKIRLDELVLPRLVEFNLSIRFSSHTYYKAGAEFHSDFNQQQLLGIVHVPPFINNHRATLRYLGYRNLNRFQHSMESITKLIGSIDHLPKLETLEVIGAAMKANPMQKKLLQNFVEGYLSQLKELSISISRPRKRDGESSRALRCYFVRFVALDIAQARGHIRALPPVLRLGKTHTPTTYYTLDIEAYVR